MSEGRTAPRLLFIDNIRWTTIVLVLSMHACDTYSPFGDWYCVDRRPAGLGTHDLLWRLPEFSAGVFHGGTLAPLRAIYHAAACDRKGFHRFSATASSGSDCRRCQRYSLVIGPHHPGISLSWTWKRQPGHRPWLPHLRDGEWLSEAGPMPVLRRAFDICGCPTPLSTPDRMERARIEPAVDHRGGMARVAIFIAIMAASTFLVRTGVRGDASVLNMHPGDFPNISSLFVRRHVRLSGQLDHGTFRARLLAAWGRSRFPLQPRCWQRLSCLAVACRAESAQYAGGFNPVSAGKCLVGSAGLRGSGVS